MSTKTEIYVISNGHEYYIGIANNAKRSLHQVILSAFDDYSPSYRTVLAQWVRDNGGSSHDAQKHLHLVKVRKIGSEYGSRYRINLIESYREKYGDEKVVNTW